MNAYNRQLRTVGAVLLTSSLRGLAPLIVPVPSAGKASFMALCYQICTIGQIRIGKLLGALSVENMTVVEEAMRRVHGL